MRDAPHLTKMAPLSVSLMAQGYPPGARPPMLALPLQTERLVLRDFREGDWEAVHRYACDPQVVRYMKWGPNSEEETKAFVQRALSTQQEDPRRAFELAVTLKETGALIGACSLHVSRPEHRQGWIGYCFHRAYWGRGYGTEAASVLIALGFEQLGLHRIFATCDARNLASARVLEKAGMRREGHLRHDEWLRGEWRDTYLYAILEHQWDPARV